MGGFGSVIKSIQRGTVTMNVDPKTVTITAVVTAKSFLLMSSTPNNASQYIPYGLLTDETTLTFISSAGAPGSQTVAWQVVEFY